MIMGMACGKERVQGGETYRECTGVRTRGVGQCPAPREVEQEQGGQGKRRWQGEGNWGERSGQVG